MKASLVWTFALVMTFGLACFACEGGEDTDGEQSEAEEQESSESTSGPEQTTADDEGSQTTGPTEQTADPAENLAQREENANRMRDNEGLPVVPPMQIEGLPEMAQLQEMMADQLAQVDTSQLEQIQRMAEQMGQVLPPTELGELEQMLEGIENAPEVAEIQQMLQQMTQTELNVTPQIAQVAEMVAQIQTSPEMAEIQQMLQQMGQLQLAEGMPDMAQFQEMIAELEDSPVMLELEEMVGQLDGVPQMTELLLLQQLMEQSLQDTAGGIDWSVFELLIQQATQTEGVEIQTVVNLLGTLAPSEEEMTELMSQLTAALPTDLGPVCQQLVTCCEAIGVAASAENLLGFNQFVSASCGIAASLSTEEVCTQTLANMSISLMPMGIATPATCQ